VVRKFGEELQLQMLQLAFRFWLGLSLGYGLEFLVLWLFLLGALALEKGATLVGYWIASKIILSVKVKVLGGGLCAYGWVTMKWKLHQMDVKTTFLNGVIEEEVYIKQTQWFEVEYRKTHVFMLKKPLYGLKQAPRAWFGIIDSFLTNLGFTKSKIDPNLYFKVMNDEPIILLLYVDDLFLTGEENLITDCKKNLIAEFEMKDLGLMHYFLGIEVWKSPEKIFLNQGKYAIEILKIFDMLECKSMNTPC
jgi:hypothetical protein